jgi:OOP family OmpA-OmpF porin
MKKTTLTIALATALLSISAAQAGEFTGGWIGAKAGNNRTDVSGAGTAALPTQDKKNAETYGIEGGYNWEKGNFLLGVDGFADFNQKKTHNSIPAGTAHYGSDTYGIDFKLGLPSGNWLPYAKLGYASSRATGGGFTGSASGAHLGLGIEYKFAAHWSLAGEYTNTSGKSNGLKLNNENVTIGVNYYFDAPAAPVVASVIAAPVIAAAPAPAPVAAPVKAEVKPAAKETVKTIFSDKPVTIEGASFATNSAKLKKTADKKLSEVVDFAAKFKESNLSVSGHTDSTGSAKQNQKLSESRAASVKAYLVKKGVAADRISTRGEASARPVADNKTKAGRAQNRRVEITSSIREAKQVRVTE